jgi:hypothetical protein
MEVETQADSGQATGNTGAASTPVNSLSDAVSAAIKATEEKHAEKPSPSVDKVAGDKPGSEDASPASDKEPAKQEPAKAEAEAPKADAPKFEAPKHWPEADRKAFAALPEDAQALIKRLSKDLEGGFTRKSQDLGDKAKYADQLRSLIDEPTRQQMQASGVSEVQYFQYLDGLQKFASRDGPGYIKWAMQNLGVTPEHLGIRAPQQPAGNQQEQSIADLLVDPKVKQLEAELAALKGQQLTPDLVRQHAQEVLHQAQATHQRYSLQGMAQQFRVAQDDSGQLLYPHFDTVRRQMGALMDTDPELAGMPDSPEKMKTAYDMAVYARPDLRQSLIEAEAQKRVTAAEKAREAARAKSVTAVKPAIGVATQSVKPKTLDEIVRENIAAVSR